MTQFQIIITVLAFGTGLIMLLSLLRLLWTFKRKRMTVVRKSLFWFKLWRTVIFVGLFVNYLATRFFETTLLPPEFAGLGIVFVFFLTAIEDHLEEWVDDAEYDQLLTMEADHQLELGQSE